MSHAAASLTSPSDGPLRVWARGAAVQTLYEQGATWVSFRPMPDLTCAIDFAIRKFPDLGLLSGTARGVRHEHTPDEAGVADGHFSFHLNISGLSIVAGKGREIALRDGDAVLLNTAVTLRPHRRTGVYTAVLGWRLDRAVRDGKTIAVVVAERSTSAPILMRKGFREVGARQIWMSV